MAEDKEAAFREIMRKQVSRIALTIKHTDVQKEELRDFLAPMSHYVRVGHELHEEHVADRPDDHLHAYLQLSAQKRLGEIYKLVQTQFNHRYYGRPDVRQLPTHTDAAKWNNYCKKDGASSTWQGQRGNTLRRTWHLTMSSFEWLQQMVWTPQWHTRPRIW